MRIEQLKIFTKELSQVANFYKKIMELPVRETGEKTISIFAGASELVIEDTGSTEDPFYHFAFNIPPGKFGEVMDWMENRVELLWLEDYNSYVADFINWNAKSFYFFDPAGNILEFIARFDLQDHVQEKFSSAHVRNISEVGLVVQNDAFDEIANSLLYEYGLEYFSKQPPLPQFRAIGDDEGLFIVVPEHRNWFATKKPSGIFPLEVTFTNQHESHSLNFP